MLPRKGHDCMVSAAQSLCLACGLCCDGTLFGWVELKSQEDVVAAQARGLNVARRGGRTIAKQPCPAHVNRACTVYEDRPGVCRTFRCELLKNLEQGGISEEAAKKIVDTTVAARTESLALASALSAEAPEVWTLIPKLLKDPSRRAAHVRLLFNFVILQKNLDRFFRDTRRAGAFRKARPAVSARLSRI